MNYLPAFRFVSKTGITALIYTLIYIEFSFGQQAYPEEFRMDYYKAAADAIASEKELSPQNAKLLYENLYETKRSLFFDNWVYFNDQNTTLVNKVVDKLLSNDKALRENVTFYVTRFASRNAISFPDGSIFVNIGLIAAVENEAQLSFVLAHEISHYKNQHARQAIKRMSSLAIEQENLENTEGNFFRRMKYSRENEFESDAYALAMMKGAGYDPNEALGSLDFLTDSLPMTVTQENVIDMLSSDLFTLDTSHFASYVSNSGSSGEKLLIREEYDLFLSHPSINKRSLALKEIMESMPEEYTGGTKFQVFEGDQFRQMVSLCEQKMIDNLFDKSEYIGSLILSLEALKKNPEDQFMKINVIRNLYQLAYFKEIKNIDNVLEINTLGNSAMMSTLNGLISKMTLDDLRKLTYGYIKKELKSLNNDEELLFYHGLVTQCYLGKEPARLIFNKYKVAHPNGKYIAYINNL